MRRRVSKHDPALAAVFAVATLSAAALGCHRAAAPLVSPAWTPVRSWPQSQRTARAGVQVRLTVIPGVSTSGPVQRIAAVIGRDIPNQRGTVLIPHGSPAQLSVERANTGDLQLCLVGVMVNGNRFSVLSASGVPGVGVKLTSVGRMDRHSARARPAISGQRIDIPPNTPMVCVAAQPFRIE